MKALSIKQPWAWLIVNGYKDVENRVWKTHFRGVFLVHASKTFDMLGYEWVREHFPDIPMPKPEEFDLGGIVGEVELIRCVNRSSSPWYAGEGFAFLLRHPVKHQFRVWRGIMGFFNTNYPKRSGD